MTIADGLGDGPEAEANARLIASAPELLAALEALLGQEDWTRGEDIDPRSPIGLARAAIAKARVPTGTKPKSPIELRPGRFYICDMPGEYAGYTTGDTTWNGWECPQFELEEAQRVVAAYNAMVGEDDGCIVWDEVSRVFSNSVTGEVWDAVGTGLYAIGAWAWCWESAVEGAV